LVQLQSALNSVEDAGITLVAVSYDPPDALVGFAAERGVTYPLLSDEGSRTIDAYAVRDPNGAGIPHPGTFLIDSAGVVRAKLFQQGYVSRPSADAIIAAARGVK
jgi:peroxiredoxin